MFSMLKNFFSGVLIGASMLLPGVSGGTTAIIVGIYDSILQAAGSFFKNPKRNFLFLLNVGFGMCLGAAAFAGIALELCNSYAVQSSFLFVGAILGSIPTLLRRSGIKGSNKKNVLLGVLFAFLGFAAGLSVCFMPSGVFSLTDSSLLSKILLIPCGVAISAAVILPGISTSHVLLILGLYESVLSAIANRAVLSLALLLSGVIIGSAALTSIMDKCMKKFNVQSYLAISGFVAASVFSVFPRGAEINKIPLYIFIVLSGFVLSSLLGRSAAKK